MKAYNGHRSRNARNVSLRINNNEIIYNTCLAMVKENRRLNQIMACLKEMTGGKTPDGAKYTRLAVKLAIDGLREKRLAIEKLRSEPNYRAARIKQKIREKTDFGRIVGAYPPENAMIGGYF